MNDILYPSTIIYSSSSTNMYKSVCTTDIAILRLFLCYVTSVINVKKAFQNRLRDHCFGPHIEINSFVLIVKELLN